MNSAERWHQTWKLLKTKPPSGLIDALFAAYREPHRAYHTLQHLEECFAHLDRCPLRPIDPGSLELALWFHDAVYDPKATDNEARSAAWANNALTTLDSDTRMQIERLILVTQHASLPSTSDEALLVDIDLSILGADPKRFSEYESQVRREYGWVPEEGYCTARAQVLGEFMARPVLYVTPHFQKILEGPARANLRRSLDALAARAPPNRPLPSR